MSILKKAHLMYNKLGTDMFRDIAMYMEHGYVLKTPTSFLLGKAVNIDDGNPVNQWNVKNPNAWFVQTAVGENHIKDFINFIPYPLPYVGWKRDIKNRGVKYFKYDSIIRRLLK